MTDRKLISATTLKQVEGSLTELKEIKFGKTRVYTPEYVPVIRSGFDLKITDEYVKIVRAHPDVYRNRGAAVLLTPSKELKGAGDRITTSLHPLSQTYLLEEHLKESPWTGVATLVDLEGYTAGYRGTRSLLKRYLSEKADPKYSALLAGDKLTPMERDVLWYAILRWGTALPAYLDTFHTHAYYLQSVGSVLVPLPSLHRESLNKFTPEFVRGLLAEAVTALDSTYGDDVWRKVAGFVLPVTEGILLALSREDGGSGNVTMTLSEIFLTLSSQLDTTWQESPYSRILAVALPNVRFNEETLYGLRIFSYMLTQSFPQVDVFMVKDVTPPVGLALSVRGFDLVSTVTDNRISWKASPGTRPNQYGKYYDFERFKPLEHGVVVEMYSQYGGYPCNCPVCRGQRMPPDQMKANMWNYFRKLHYRAASGLLMRELRDEMHNNSYPARWVSTRLVNRGSMAKSVTILLEDLTP